MSTDPEPLPELEGFARAKISFRVDIYTTVFKEYSDPPAEILIEDLYRSLRMVCSNLQYNERNRTKPCGSRSVNVIVERV